MAFPPTFVLAELGIKRELFLPSSSLLLSIIFHGYSYNKNTKITYALHSLVVSSIDTTYNTVQFLFNPTIGLGLNSAMRTGYSLV